jgi:hypothetical protein
MILRLLLSRLPDFLIQKIHTVGRKMSGRKIGGRASADCTNFQRVNEESRNGMAQQATKETKSAVPLRLCEICGWSVFASLPSDL